MRLGEVSTFEMGATDACGPDGGAFRALLEVVRPAKGAGGKVQLELELRSRTSLCRLSDADGLALDGTCRETEDVAGEASAQLWIRRRRPEAEQPHDHSRVRFHLRVRAAPHGSLATDMPWVPRGAPLLDTKVTGARVSFALGGAASSCGLLERAVRKMHLGDSARLLLGAGAFAAGRSPDAAAPEQLRRLLASWQGPLELQILGLAADTAAAAAPRPRQVVAAASVPAKEACHREDCERRIRQTFSEIQAVCQEASTHTGHGDACSASVCYKRGFELARSLSSLEPVAKGLPAGAAVVAGLARQRQAAQLAMFTNLVACRLRGLEREELQSRLEEVLHETERELGLEPEEAAPCRRHAAAKLGRAAPGACEAGCGAEALAGGEPVAAVTARSLQPPAPSDTPVLLSYSPGDEGVPLSFPSPLVTQGIPRIDEAALRVASGVEEKGTAAYADELFRETRRAVELQFGPVAGSRLGRLEPCVGMIARQEQLQGYEPGLGRRQLSSYVAGLEPQKPFHDTADYPWCASLAASASSIMAELRAHEHIKELWTTGNRDAPEWRSIVLVKRGLWMPIRHFPKTKALFMSLRGVRPMEVCLARMPPHTKIQPHSDNTNFLLTAHLGLEVAEGCTLHVGEWAREWRPGQAMVFDHSYIHSASNDSERDRYVMVFRFYHPGCSDEESYALSYLALLLESVLRDGRVGAVFEAEHRAGQFGARQNC